MKCRAAFKKLESSLCLLILMFEAKGRPDPVFQNILRYAPLLRCRQSHGAAEYAAAPLLAFMRKTAGERLLEGSIGRRHA
jgi:hypothetical protein